MFNKMVKMRNQKGFTLMELLIVVAIIAILVAISIPIFSSQLEKARVATDDANMRAAKSVATAMYLAGGTIDAGTQVTALAASPAGLKYDAVKGVLTTGTVTGYGKAQANVDKVINVSWLADGTMTLTWGAATASNPG